MKRKKLLAVIMLALSAAVCGGMDASAVWQMDEVNVVGERYDADNAQSAPIASGLIGTKQEVGALGKKDVLDVPFQQMTFTKQAIETFSQPGRSAMDALSLSPSVRTTKGSMDTNLYIRGFSAGSGSWTLNGIPSMSHQMTMPTNYMDKMEVLSGPNIGVNGVGIFMAGSVGGTVSATTKKAQDKPNFSAGLSWASDSYFTETIDLGKRFGGNNEWGVRINALHANGDLAVDGTKDKKRDIAVNIDHRAKRSKSNIFFSYDYDEQWGRNNTISLGKLDQIPAVPKNKTHLAPRWIDEKYENYTFIANHEQYLNGNLTWFANFGWRWEDYSKDLWGNRTLKDLAGNYTGSYQETPVFHHYTYFGTGFKGKFMMGRWKNEWSAGVDWTRFSRDRNNVWSAENTYKIDGNIYENNTSPAPTIVWDPITPHQKMMMRSLAVLDTISSPDERMMFTFGVHWHEVETTNYVNKSYIKSHAASPVLGLIYKFTPRFSFYANHGEHFTAGSTVGNKYTNHGETIPPSKTKQNEFGFKYKDGNLLHTLSFYEIKQANGIGILNADGTETYKLDGQQRNRGIEFSTAGSIGEKWSYVWGVSYLDAKQTKTYKGLNDGRRVDALPKWSSDLALVYKPNDDLRFIGRLSYTGSALIRNTASYAKPLKIGGQTLVDLGVSWDTHFGRQPVTLSAWCYNLLDKDYWYASGGNNIGLGAPRTFAISAQFNF